MTLYLYGIIGTNIRSAYITQSILSESIQLQKQPPPESSILEWNPIYKTELPKANPDHKSYTLKVTSDERVIGYMTHDGWVFERQLPVETDTKKYIFSDYLCMQVKSETKNTDYIESQLESDVYQKLIYSVNRKNI